MRLSVVLLTTDRRIFHSPHSGDPLTVEKAGIPFPGNVELLSVGEVDLEMVGGDGDRGFGIRGHNLSSKVNQLTAKPVYFRIEGV
jgi:hypothetical protein